MDDRTVTAARPETGGSLATDASLLDLPSIESTVRTVGDVDLHVVEAGDAADPLVVLLHGFPEFWYGWRDQIGPLAEAGYRVLVPDQRGYNLSESADGLDGYRLSALSADVAALVDDEGRSSAHVVGHDWGAMVAWDLALRRPATVDRLCVANVPHPTAMAEALRSTPRQLVRSWYALFFQFPWLPERVLSAGDYRALQAVLEATAAPETFDDRDLAAYRAAWNREGALTGMLDWYRAYLRRSRRPSTETVTQPTRVLWGVQDAALLPSLADWSLAYCERGDLRRFEAATHWVHLERPELFTDAVLEHLDG